MIYIIISIVFVLINFKFFYILFEVLPLKDFIYESSIYFIILLFLSILFSFNRFLNRIWIFLLLLCSLIVVYFIDTMGIEINKQIIHNILETNTKEAIELLGYQYFIYIFVVFILMFFLYKKVILRLSRKSIGSYVIAVFSLIVIFYFLTKIDEPKYRAFIKKDTPRILPLSLFPAIGTYIKTVFRENTIHKKNISKYFQYKLTANKPLVAVLIIGESARSDRFSLNGYKRNTTPLLIKKRNLISFLHAKSCDTSTLSSVSCLVQRIGKKEFEFPIRETSFVQVMKDFGFKTYWITLQNEAKVIHTFCEEAEECIDLSSKRYDMDAMNIFERIIDNVKQDTLIVIHTMGSHMQYNQRVPKKDRVFLPLCKGSETMCLKQNLDNSYDNTIFYTDKVLSNIIEKLINKNAFLIYTSDHGESLGEHYLGLIKRFGHASPYNIAPKEQIEVPFIAWFSDIYLKEYNVNISQLKLKNNISHDFIFHSILGCAGFHGEKLNQKFNICHSTN